MSNEKGEYLLFMGDNFYPKGGWVDFKGYFSSIDEINNHINDIDQYEFFYDVWAHIVKDSRIILKGEGDNPSSIEWKEYSAD